MEQPEGQPELPVIVRKALFWKKVGYTNIYSMRLVVPEEHRGALAPGEDGEWTEIIGVPDDVDWLGVIAALENKHHGVLKVRWFYPMGNVDMFLKQIKE